MERHNQEIFKKINELLDENIEFALLTITKATANSPGRLGFKMLVLKDGTTFGTVGGGELEFQATKEALSSIKEKKSKTIEYNLTPDLKMACGGRVELFIEYFEATKKAYLFGGGHMGVDLTPILASLGFRVIVIDNREDYAKSSRFLNVSEVINADYLEYAENFKPSESDAVVIFTHGHTYDYDILDILCRRNIDVKYIGVIGAKNKINMIKKKISSSGYGNDLIDRVYAPIGLNIATKTTPEISVAIAAEIVAVYNGVKDIKFMSR